MPQIPDGVTCKTQANKVYVLRSTHSVAFPTVLNASQCVSTKFGSHGPWNEIPEHSAIVEHSGITESHNLSICFIDNVGTRANGC